MGDSLGLLDIDVVVKKKNRQLFSVILTLIDNDIRHQSSQNLLRIHSAAPYDPQNLTAVTTNIVVDKS